MIFIEQEAKWRWSFLKTPASSDLSVLLRYEDQEEVMEVDFFP